MKLKNVVLISFLFISVTKDAFGCYPGMILDMHLWLPTSILLSIFSKVVVISYFLKKAYSIISVKFRIYLYIVNALYALSLFAIDIYNVDIFLNLLLVLYVIVEPGLIFITLKPKNDDKTMKKERPVTSLIAKSYMVFILGNIVFVVTMFGTGAAFINYGTPIIHRIFHS